MIRQLDWELIYTLKQCLSITKTSEKLYMTQPAVTKRLHQLEEEFGTPLVFRTAKGVTFTTKGEYIADYAEKMVGQYNEFLSTVLEKKLDIRGTINIATCGSLARFLLPELLGNFKKLNPGIEYSLMSDYSFRVSQLVNTHVAQVGFIRGEHVNGCERISLGKNQAYALYSKPFVLEDLPSLPRIEFYKDQLVSSSIDAWWYKRYTSAPKIAMTVPSGSTCVEMVKNGLGYAIFLSSEFFNKDDGLYTLPLYASDGTPLIREDWLIYHEESMQLDYVNSFIDYAQNYISQSRSGIL